MQQEDKTRDPIRNKIIPLAADGGAIMADQFEHKGHRVDIDIDVPEGPRVRIDGKDVPVKRIGAKFLAPELPYLEAENIRDLAKAVVEQSRRFETHE